MDVKIDEARRNHLPARVDHVVGARSQSWRNLAHEPIIDKQVKPAVKVIERRNQPASLDQQ